MVLMARVRPDTVMWRNLQKQNCLDIEDFYQHAKKYIQIDNAKENLGKGLIEGSSHNYSSKKKRNDQVDIVTDQGNKKQRPVERSACPSLPRYSLNTEINEDRESIFLMTKGRVPIRRPPLL